MQHDAFVECGAAPGGCRGHRPGAARCGGAVGRPVKLVDDHHNHHRPGRGESRDIAPPAGTLSTTRSQKSTNPDGSQTTREDSTFRNNRGVATDSTTTTIAPAIPPVTTERSTTPTTTRP